MFSPFADGQAGGEFNGLNRAEALERVRAEEWYRDTVIRAHQARQEAKAPPEEKHDADFEGGEGAVASVLLAGESTRSVPVKPLIDLCDTARRMVASRWRRGGRRDAANGSAGGDDANAGKKNDDKETTSEEGGKRVDSPIIEISLVEFDADAVMQFMDVLISLHDHQQNERGPPPNQTTETTNNNHTSVVSPETTRGSGGLSSRPGDLIFRKRRIGDVTEETATEHLASLLDEGRISERHIVEHIKLAHYLQCRSVLNTLVPIIERSIDSRNCMAICSLADTLNLKSLFEASVNHVIERLDAFQGTAPLDGGEGGGGRRKPPSASCGDNNGGSGNKGEEEENESSKEIWATLPHELRSRVLTMRNVLRSSVIGRGSKVSGLFFSSGTEFLAIFRETLQEQRERLAEARERGDEVVRERTEEWLARSRRRGRWFDRSAEAEREFVYGPDVVYALDKIEKQSRRLETLQTFYDEQKEIFGRGFAGDGEIRL